MAGSSFSRAKNIADMIPRHADPQAVRQRVEILEALMENAFTIPGLKRRIGLDAIIGLVPVLGDMLTAAMGAYVVWEARNLGLSRWHLARMAANVGIDTLLGAVPVLGDLFDIAFRSNTRNLSILRKQLDKHHPAGAIIEG